MLIDKLSYIVEYGRTVGKLEGLIDDLYRDIFGKVKLVTNKSISHLHQAATRLNDMGLYSDALAFFRAAPTPTKPELAIACATCNYYVGSPR